MIETVLQAARAAGEIQRACYGSLLTVDQALRNDIKLEVDRRCESAILEVIRSHFPEDAVLTEEAGVLAGVGERVWIVDPLDGTVNYFYGVPYFCTSIACCRRLAVERTEQGFWGVFEPLAAAIYAPLGEEMFAAESGAGAHRNGERIAVQSVSILEESMVATGFGSTQRGLQGLHTATTALAGRVRKMRCMGAAAYDLANVACGRFSAFCEVGLHTWDIAAGALLLREAGGRLDARCYEQTRWEVLACAPGIQPALREALHWDEAAG